MSVSSCPEGKTTMLRANVMVVAGLVSLFGEAAEDEQSEDGGDYGGNDGAVQGAVKYIPGEIYSCGRINCCDEINA